MFWSNIMFFTSNAQPVAHSKFLGEINCIRIYIIYISKILTLHKSNINVARQKRGWESLSYIYLNKLYINHNYYQ